MRKKYSRKKLGRKRRSRKIKKFRRKKYFKKFARKVGRAVDRGAEKKFVMTGVVTTEYDMQEFNPVNLFVIINGIG